MIAFRLDRIEDALEILDGDFFRGVRRVPEFDVVETESGNRARLSASGGEAAVRSVRRASPAGHANRAFGDLDLQRRTATTHLPSRGTARRGPHLPRSSTLLFRRAGRKGLDMIFTIILVLVASTAAVVLSRAPRRETGCVFRCGFAAPADAHRERQISGGRDLSHQRREGFGRQSGPRTHRSGGSRGSRRRHVRAKDREFEVEMREAVEGAARLLATPRRAARARQRVPVASWPAAKGREIPSFRRAALRRTRADENARHPPAPRRRRRRSATAAPLSAFFAGVRPGCLAAAPDSRRAAGRGCRRGASACRSSRRDPSWPARNRRAVRPASARPRGRGWPAATRGSGVSMANSRDDDTLDIAVDDDRAAAEGDGGDGGGRIGADARQRPQSRFRVGKAAAMHRRATFARRPEDCAPARNSRGRPRRCITSASSAAASADDVRPAVEEARVIGRDRRRRRLLEHDLRQPDAIGIGHRRRATAGRGRARSYQRRSFAAGVCMAAVAANGRRLSTALWAAQALGYESAAMTALRSARTRPRVRNALPISSARRSSRCWRSAASRRRA